MGGEPRPLRRLLTVAAVLLVVGWLGRRALPGRIDLSEDPVGAMEALSGRYPTLPWREIELRRRGPECAGGDMRACSELGLGYTNLLSEFEGFGLPRCLGHALFDLACAGGDALGCYRLGDDARTGTCGPQDTRQARVLYDRACADHLEDACRAYEAL
jgi:TPR repeat protein